MKFKLQLIDNWKSCWKFYSFWVNCLIFAMPDIYAAVQAMGYLDDESIPQPLRLTIKTVAVVAVFVRLVKQQSLAKPPV